MDLTLDIINASMKLVQKLSAAHPPTGHLRGGGSVKVLFFIESVQRAEKLTELGKTNQANILFSTHKVIFELHKVN